MTLGAAHPFYFGPAARPLFAWYHAPASACRGAVVLCNPLGLDGTRAHWSYRHLAERLAGAGFGVLRFDWHGTGDSSGDDHEPARVTTWLGDLAEAIEEVKRRSGAPRVGLVGMRAGATLAARVAAAREDVGAVVLWSPALTGAAWVNEMVKLHKLYLRLVPQVDGLEPGGEELLGSFASHETIAALAGVDLLALTRRPATDVLVLDDGPLREGPQLREHLRVLGAAVTWQRGSGQRFLFTVPHKATLPEASIQAIVSWLSAAPEGGGPSPAPAAPRTTPFDEQPLRFGVADHLFGVLSRPTSPPVRERPAIVILNAGSVNRAGPHRLYVSMARRWVGRGFTVLRLDLSGIGDSPAAVGTAENLVYPRDGLADIAAAMDFLAAETGVGRFIVAGLCSGADLTFQIARRDPRLVGAVMMNPRTFLELDLGRVERPVAPAPGPDPAATEESLRVTAGLGEIAARDVDALLLVSDRDPGIDYVDRHAPAAIGDAERLPRFRRVNVAGTDHTFTTIASQRRAVDLITDEYLVHHE